MSRSCAAPQAFSTAVVDVSVGGTVSAPTFADAPGANNLYLDSNPFRTGDKVVYQVQGNGSPVAGLLNGKAYRVVVDAGNGNLIQLRNTLGPTSLSFARDATNGDSIVRNDGGDWLNDGFAAGQQIAVSGAANNNQTWTIASIAGNRLVLTARGSVTAETDASASVDGALVEVTPDKSAAGAGVIHTLSMVSIGGLQDGVTYYVKSPTATGFKLAASVGGPAIASLDTSGLAAASVFTLAPEGIDLGSAGGVAHTLTIDLRSSAQGVQRLLAPGGASLSTLSPRQGDGVSTATSKGSGGGFVGVNGNRADLTANPTVSATVDGQSIAAQGAVSIGSTSITGTTANAQNGTGGFVAIGDADATSTSINTSSATVGAGSQIHAGGDFILAATSSTRHGDVSARSVGGGFAADVDANTTVSTQYGTTASVASGATVSAGGDLQVLADSSASGTAKALADGKGFGGGGYTNSRNTLANGLTAARIGQGATLDGQRLTISAGVSSMDLKARGEGYGAGFVGVSHDYATVNVKADNQVLIDNDATLSGSTGVDLLANFRQVSTGAYSFAQATGLFGHVISNAYNDSTLDSTVLTGLGSTVAAAPRDNSGYLALVANTANSNVSIAAEAHDSKRALAAGGSDSHANADGSARIDWSGDVAIHSGPNAELVIDAGGAVSRQVNVDYSVAGNVIKVNGIAGLPGRVQFIADNIVGAGGSWDFQDSLKEIRIINSSSRDLQINDIDPLVRSAQQPQVELRGNNGKVSLNFAITRSVTPTLVDIANLSSANILLNGTIENPIGTTRIVNTGGSIRSTKSRDDTGADGLQSLIRSHSLLLEAGNGTLGNIGADSQHRVNVDLVQSVAAPAAMQQLSVLAGGNAHLDLKARLRDAAVSVLGIDFDAVTAGGDIDLLLQSSVRETPLIETAGGVRVTLPGDAYANTHYSFFRPDSGQGPGFTSSVLTTATQAIAGSYFFNRAGLLAGGNITLTAAQALASDPVLNLAAITDVLGNGRVSALTHGNIAITETAGDLRLGTIQANAGDVALTSSSGSIHDTAAAGVDIGSTPWMLGDAISLTARHGGIGTLADFLEIDSSRSTDALVDARSQASVFLRETAGDLRLGGVVSLVQDAVLITLAGSIVDGVGDDNITLLASGSSYTGAAISGGVANQAAGAVSVVAGDNVHVPVGTLIRGGVSVLVGGDGVARDTDADGATIDIEGDLQAPNVIIEGGKDLDYLQINDAAGINAGGATLMRGGAGSDRFFARADRFFLGSNASTALFTAGSAYNEPDDPLAFLKGNLDHLGGIVVAAGSGGNGGTVDAIYVTSESATSAVTGTVSGGLDGSGRTVGRISGFGMSGDIQYSAADGVAVGVQLTRFDDTMAIDAVSSTVYLAIDGSDGNDTLNVGQAAGSVAGIQGILSFSGGAGVDTLNVFGDASSTAGQLSAISITGMGMCSNQLLAVHNDNFGAGYNLTDVSWPGAIYYARRSLVGNAGNTSETISSSVEAVNVQLGAGDDRFTVQLASAVATTIRVDGGSQAVADTLLVVGTANADRLVVSGAGVDHDGLHLVAADVEKLTVDGAGGDDAISLSATPVAFALTLLGDAGDDAFAVAYPTSAASLQVDGGDGSNGLAVTMTAGDDVVELGSASLAVPGSDSNAASSLLPHLFAYPPAIPTGNFLSTSGGGRVLPYASVVSDFGHHLDLLPGNDVLRGGSGNDTLVGDDLLVIAPAVSFDTAAMAGGEILTRNLLSVSADFADLVHRQYALLGGKHDAMKEKDDDPVVIDRLYRLGEDVLDGGSGDDLLIGDNSINIAPSFKLPVGLAAKFELFQDGVADAADEIAGATLDLVYLEHRLRDQLVQVAKGKKFETRVEHHLDLIMMGNDMLTGGDGKDLIVGDQLLVRAPLVTLIAGGPPVQKGHNREEWRDAERWQERGKRAAWWKDLGYDGQHRFQLDAIQINADSIVAGSGNDLIWGDSVALLGSTITRAAGIADTDYKEASRDVQDGLDRLLTVRGDSDLWFSCAEHGHDHDPEHWTWVRYDDGEWESRHHHAHDGGDFIDAGAGDDIVYGQDGQDSLLGGSGNDWLIGGSGDGSGKDLLDGGAGVNKLYSGDNNSSQLRDLVKAGMPTWATAFRSSGLPIVAFGTNTRPASGQPNRADYDKLEFIASPWGANNLLAEKAAEGVAEEVAAANAVDALIAPITPAAAAIDALLAQARQGWLASGLGDDALLDSIQVNIADLGGKDRLLLGETRGSVITLDDDAAGWGWFADPTPAATEEFRMLPDGTCRALPGSNANGRVDLLTVISHEIGHLLGYAHGEDGNAAGDPMNARLAVGVRELPASPGWPDLEPTRSTVDARLDAGHLPATPAPATRQDEAVVASAAGEPPLSSDLPGAGSRHDSAFLQVEGRRSAALLLAHQTAALLADGGASARATAEESRPLPQIDWQRRYFAADDRRIATPAPSASWRRDFVNHLGKDDGQRKPNASLRVQVEVSPPPAPKLKALDRA